MPNWCKGVFKIRGTKKQIANYFEEFLEGVDFLGVTSYGVEVELSESSIKVKTDLEKKTVDLVREGLPSGEPEHLYFKGSSRAFIQDTNISIDCWTDDLDEEIVVSLQNFKQSWGIRAEDFVAASKELGIDFKIFGYELGAQFTQEVEIVDGKITKNEIKTYDDYEWNVPFSNLGG